MLKSWAWLIVVAFYLILSSWYVHSERSDKIFNGDSAGYYAYLPAFVSGQDHQFEQLEKAEKEAKIYSNYRLTKNDHLLNKYPVGVAICLLPFYCLALLFGGGPFGESMQIMILLGSTFYLSVAAYYFDRLCHQLGFNRLLAGVLFIGTNLTYYAVAEPLMSHVYSFSLFCISLFLLKQFIDHHKTKDLSLLALFIGLLIIIRPVNLIGVLMLPFVLNLFGTNLKSLLSQLSTKKAPLTWLLLPIIIQCVIWYLQTGSFVIWSYANEGFNWFDPHIWEVWFSFKKGLFIYAPILMMVFVAIWHSIRTKNKLALMFSIPFIITTFVISCWWSWYYGDGFGHRAFIEFYPFMFLMILANLRPSQRTWLLPSLLTPLVLLSLVQSWQYEKGIMHPNSMTGKKYAHIFLKTGDSYIGCLGNEQEATPYGLEKKILTERSWKHLNSGGDEYLISSEVSSNQELFIELSAEKYSEDLIDYKGTLLTAQGINSDGETEYIKTIPYFDINTESYQEWIELKTELVIPKAPMVRIYIWNRKHLHFELKNVDLTVFELH